jgi:hypothetical protein
MEPVLDAPSKTGTANINPAWFKTPVDVGLSAHDPNPSIPGTGVKEIHFFTKRNGNIIISEQVVAGSTAQFSVVDEGITEVTYWAVDNAGNASEPSTFSVRYDATAPVITAPGNQSAEATGPGGAAVMFTVSAQDNVDSAVAAIATPASGSLFPLGLTTVNVEATDEAGNTSQKSFTVEVVDTTAPTFNNDGQITDMLVEATGPAGAAVSFNTPTATDIVDQSVQVTSSHASGSTFPIGETVVTFTAEDDFGNKAYRTFKVKVQDTTAPTLVLPADITVVATSASGNVVTYPAPTATDIVDGSITPTSNPASGSLFPVGTTTVNVSATDNHNNTTSGSFKVNVIYSWSNLLQPINADGTSIFKLGSTIPVKFRLTGASAGITNANAKLYVAKVSDGIAGVEAEAVSTSAADTGNAFRYDATGGQYIFNLSTRLLSQGTYQLRIDLGDGASHTVIISLKK